MRADVFAQGRLARWRAHWPSLWWRVALVVQHQPLVLGSLGPTGRHADLDVRHSDGVETGLRDLRLTPREPSSIFYVIDGRFGDAARRSVLLYHKSFSLLPPPGPTCMHRHASAIHEDEDGVVSMLRSNVTTMNNMSPH